MVSLILSLSLFAAVEQLPPPASATAQTITRDGAAGNTSRSGAGVIRGRVTERDTGRPIPRAIVMLDSPAIPHSPQDGPVQTRTDSDGRYEFTALPAGEYSVTVRPDEYRALYLPHVFGEDQPANFARMRRARRLTLSEGETREDTNVALWRALAIEGRVVDEFGEPMSAVPIRPRSAETAQDVAMSGPFEFYSDDRGIFRVFGLRPGSYYVCASPRHYSMHSGADVDARYVDTCHPAAVANETAQSITLSNGDVGGIEIRVQRSRAFTVSGTAVNSSGDPLQQGQVHLFRYERGGGGGGGSIEVREGGRFIARGLTPGEYSILANTAPPRGPDDKQDGELAFVPFRIESSDVEGLVVVTTKTANVRGQVIFEHGLQSAAAASMHVQTVPDFQNGMRMMGRPARARVEADLTFELSGLFEPVSVIVDGAPAGWMVKSIRYKGRDVTDTYVDFTGTREGDSMEIILTNRVARLSGRTLDDSGHPTEDALVVLMHADPTRRDGRTVRSSQAGPDGAFKIGPVRAGEYLIVAVTNADEMIGPRSTAKFVERAAAVADRITLAENEELVVQLRVVRVQ